MHKSKNMRSEMSYKNHSAILVLFIAAFSAFSACKEPEVKEYSQHYGKILMGTRAEVTVYGLDELFAQTAGYASHLADLPCVRPLVKRTAGYYNTF